MFVVVTEVCSIAIQSIVRAFMLPPQYEYDPCSSGILRSVYWWFRIDVSIQPISPIFKGQIVQELAEYSTTRPLKTGPTDCPETSVRNYQSTLRKNPGDCRPHSTLLWLFKTMFQMNNFYQKNLWQEEPLLNIKYKVTNCAVRFKECRQISQLHVLSKLFTPLGKEPSACFH